MRFEWDESKRLKNLSKHGLDFLGIEPLFEPNGQLLAAPDSRKNYGEDRFIGYGRLMGKTVAICFTLRGQTTRLISLRKANQRETKKYEQALKGFNQAKGQEKD